MSRPSGPADQRAYWRRNLRYLAILLSIWFLVSYGAGILFVEPLNELRVPGTGFPVGFWFAQQGSILVFVVLIFVYVWLMNRLDTEFGLSEPDGGATGAGVEAAAGSADEPVATATDHGASREGTAG